MQTTHPFNIEVPEFRPSRDAPIYPYTIRKYPCQENVALQRNTFGSLTWKIQQPDASMVWSAVKLVMPMTIQAFDNNLTPVDMRVCRRLPACNVALAETPMNAFRETTLGINGRMFSEVNWYRSVLDTCFRGEGVHQYGDNHSLKPIVTRDLIASPDTHVFQVINNAGNRVNGYVRRAVVLNDTAARSNNLLMSNGPFIERARAFQDRLSHDGLTWTGDITSLLELGPFQSRDRKGNSAVPYIRDFHLRLQWIGNESRHDQLIPSVYQQNAEMVRGRMMSSRLLEFATPPNILVAGEVAGHLLNFACGFVFTFTAKPYLEITYTKFMDPMRSTYLLRCFERQYEKSLPRFHLNPTAVGVVQASKQRLTTRLNNMPTKIFLWADHSDDWKGAFVTGGTRRSCLLQNLHCRINQRSDVIFNPSQEDCYEMFQRNTTSPMEYAAWLKSPIYCFTPTDLGQPDMFANDARITWMEWDCDVTLTPLQIQERNHQKEQLLLTHCGYDASYANDDEIKSATDNPAAWVTVQPFFDFTRYKAGPKTWSDNYSEIAVSIISSWAQESVTTNYPHIDFNTAGDNMLNTAFRMRAYDDFVGNTIPPVTNMDTTPKSIVNKNFFQTGLIFAIVCCVGGDRGKLLGNNIYYCPRTWRSIPADKGVGQKRVNTLGIIQENNSGQTDQNGDPVWEYTINQADMDNVYIWKATIKEGPGVGKIIGSSVAGDGSTAWPDSFPGPIMFLTDHEGVRNTADGDDQAYDLAGPLVGPNIPRCKESDPKKYRWIAFSPDTTVINGNKKWLEWRSDNANVVPAQVATETVATGWGEERVNVTFKTINGEINRYNNAKNVNVEVVSSPTYAPYGVPLTRIVQEGHQNISAPMYEFQLKGLYENGNAQYEFNDQGQPTRVLRNNLAVGPKMGIPDLDYA